MLRFEESAIQRRYKFQEGVVESRFQGNGVVGARLAVEEEVNLEKIQRLRRNLGRTITCTVDDLLPNKTIIPLPNIRYNIRYTLYPT